MTKPSPKQIQELIKDSTFKWLLSRVAYHLNSIDTVRDIENGDDKIAQARRMAIEIVENAFGDLAVDGEIRDLQTKISDEEKNALTVMREVSEKEY